MSKPEMAAPKNRILAALPSGELEMLRPYLEPIGLEFRRDIYAQNSPIEYLYFVHCGVVSLMSEMKDGIPVEVATIGPEGMVGIAVFLGASQMTTRAFVQVAGDGARIAANDFRGVIRNCPELQKLLMRYAVALMTQMAQNAACNRAHSIEERCARWLLMTQDRVHASSFLLTQAFLAQMLGVRRPTVSIAAGMLATAGLISYARGQITIIDRDGLEEASCECYRTISEEFERLVGSRG